MKVSLEKAVDYLEVDADYTVAVAHLYRLLQQAAVAHSERAGESPRKLLKSGFAWILRRIRMDIRRYPEYGETVRATTWHRGSKGFWAYRDYRLEASGQPIGAATSQWLYLDTGRRRIVKIPPESTIGYTTEPEAALDIDINAWNPDDRFQPEFTCDISIRKPDFDPLGHVNNAVYIDYLETLLLAFMGNPAKMSQFGIQYIREIDVSAKSIRAGLEKTAQGYRFKMFGEKETYACGEFRLQDGETDPPIMGAKRGSSPS